MEQHTAQRYHVDRPTDIRQARPWHRYAHHVNTLPRRLEELVPDLRLGRGDRVLDYGCADAPYRGFFPRGVEYVGADLEGNLDAALVLNSDGTVPAPDASFDAVMSTQVLEHVADPVLYLSECYRVLRPGGRLLLSTHGIFVYHPDPVDLWRWTCSGLQKAVVDAGFEVRRFEGIIGLAATGIQLVQDSVYHHLPGRTKALFALAMQSLIRLADRLTSRRSRELNAQVFALIAEKP